MPSETIDSELDSSETIREEYETLLYGFAVDEFIAECKYIVNISLFLSFHHLILGELFVKKKLIRKLGKFKDYIVKKLAEEKIDKVGGNEEFEENLKKMIEESVTSTHNMLKEKIDKELVPYINESLKIPDNVLLYSNLEQADDGYTSEDESQLEQEVQRLEMQIHEVKGLWNRTNIRTNFINFLHCRILFISNLYGMNLSHLKTLLKIIKTRKISLISTTTINMIFLIFE